MIVVWVVDECSRVRPRWGCMSDIDRLEQPKLVEELDLHSNPAPATGHSARAVVQP